MKTFWQNISSPGVYILLEEYIGNISGSKMQSLFYSDNCPGEQDRSEKDNLVCQYLLGTFD